VAVLVFPEFQTLDAVGPVDVLDGLNQFLDTTAGPSPRYAVQLVAADAGLVRSDSGMGIHADTSLRDATGPVDTLIVAGGRGVRRAAADEQVIDWIRGCAGGARRVCSVCSGAFVLAAAGLLDGHTVTTHWARAEQLAAEYPEVVVDADPIHRRSGKIWTSAGVTAGIDLALALVEEDHGPDAAQTVARWLVMFLRRPGGQSQFAAPVWTEGTGHESVRAAQEAVHVDPAADHSIETMARRQGFSTRHFTRVFSAEVGCTPARYVERVRVEAARRELETTTVGLTGVARACGFGTTETMRRSFLRQVGVTPSDYRGRFRTAVSNP
jgi:transcriptional regulator GlxA family with amidase domain